MDFFVHTTCESSFAWAFFAFPRPANACTLLLINVLLNEDNEPNSTTNHRSPRAKRIANYAVKIGIEGVLCIIRLATMIIL
jgi:hypothetical protein